MEIWGSGGTDVVTNFITEEQSFFGIDGGTWAIQLYF